MSAVEDEKRGGYESPLEKSISESASGGEDGSERDWTAEEEKKLV